MPRIKNGAVALRQQLFVKHYLTNGFAPGKAALAAGYSPKSAGAIGTQLLNNPRVNQLIEEGKKKLFSKYDVSAERVVQELAYLGFSNMQDYMRVTEDGSAVLDLSNLTREQAAAISQLDSEVYTERSGEDGEQVKRTRIKLADKRGPLELLGKYTGIFKEDDIHKRDVTVRVLYKDKNRALGVEVTA